MAFDKVYVQYIHLASNEYGSDKMEKFAADFLRDPAHADKKPLVVMVHEHGGWWLGFTLIGDTVTVVYSANDCAVYSGSKKHFRDDAYHAEWIHVGPGIRREPR